MLIFVTLTLKIFSIFFFKFVLLASLGTLKTILFLIGVQELGQGIKDFDKEEKTYLFHIAICKLLSPFGYYRFKMIDEDGWPHYEETKDMEKLPSREQKLLMKEAIISYFQ